MNTVDALFRPFDLRGLKLRNRIVMAPMTRSRAPGGLFGADNIAYYRRRAEAGVGLIVSEGTWIDDPAASNRNTVPRFFGDDALAGWKQVIDAVHQAGGAMMPQLWHVGMVRPHSAGNPHPEAASVGPSALDLSEPDLDLSRGGELSARPGCTPPTEARITALIESYARAARHAWRLGFDGIELHGAHGYLIDQFLWSRTNRRTDRYGGGIGARARFAAEVVRACRRNTSADFPISLRYSQWKTEHYEARLVDNPAELAELLEPLADAGVDIFHCSTRRYWEAEFPGSSLNLAGWTKKITGKTSIAVGAVGLDSSFKSRDANRKINDSGQPASLDRLIAMLEREEFDLVAVGRALLVDHEWPIKVRNQDWDRLTPFTTQSRELFY